MKILLSVLLATAIPVFGQSPEPATEKKSPSKTRSSAVTKEVSEPAKKKSPIKRQSPVAKDDDAEPTKKKSTTKRQPAGISEDDPESAGKKKSPEKTQSVDIDEESSGPAKQKVMHGKPAIIGTEQLVEFETLPEDRKQLISGAIAVAKDSPWLPYQFGGADPKAGGFDCSGAMYYVMCKADLEPPRSSAEQFLWLKEHDRLTEISSSIRSLDHPDFKKLLPGDLLFWGGTYSPADGRKVNITHVAMYLGHEKSDKRTVMINATDGRSYRGTKSNGYGVYDFQLPRDGSKAIFMGYGTPPGIKQ
jgi:cell wall-associated NlpC family hydrolase